MQRSTTLCFFRIHLFSWLLALAFPASAPEVAGGPSRASFYPYEAGFRVGSSIPRRDDFRQYELFTAVATPWGWADRHRRLETRLELHGAAGVLRGRGQNEGIFQLGPAVTLTPPPFPVYLSLGIAPTYLTGRQFDDVDFGQRLQITSSATATWMINPDVGLRYRIQHMSNARMAQPNPGLDIHSAGIVIAF